jgi:WD40 repeat protein
VNVPRRPAGSDSAVHVASHEAAQSSASGVGVAAFAIIGLVALAGLAAWLAPQMMRSSPDSHAKTEVAAPEAPADPAGPPPPAFQLIDDVMLPVGGGFVHEAAFSYDGGRIATASEDQLVRIWDAYSGTLMQTLPQHEAYAARVMFSRDGSLLVTSTQFNTYVWDLYSGSLLAGINVMDAKTGARLSPDGTRILMTPDGEYSASVWEARTGRQLLTLSHAGGFTNGDFSRDGRLIVTTNWDHTARIWDAYSGGLIAILSRPEAVFADAAFSPDASRVVTTYFNAPHGTGPDLWDARSGMHIAQLSGAGGTPRRVAFAPDGAHIITAMDPGAVHLWSADGALISELHGMSNTINHLMFSPNGRFAAAMGWDEGPPATAVTRIWDTSTALEIATLRGYRSGAFSSDSTRFVGAGEGVAQVFRIELTEPPAISMTP